MFKCLGKLLIVVTLCFQAWLLFENKTLATEFDNKLTQAVTACHCIPSNIAGLLIQYGRFVILGLLGSSAFMLVAKCWGIKLMVLIGLIASLWIEHQPFTKFPCVGCATFWAKVSTIGALIYLMGAECSSSSCKKAAAPVKAKSEEKGKAQ